MYRIDTYNTFGLSLLAVAIVLSLSVSLWFLFAILGLYLWQKFHG